MPGMHRSLRPVRMASVRAHHFRIVVFCVGIRPGQHILKHFVHDGNVRHGIAGGVRHNPLDFKTAVEHKGASGQNRADHNLETAYVIERQRKLPDIRRRGGKVFVRSVCRPHQVAPGQFDRFRAPGRAGSEQNHGTVIQIELRSETLCVMAQHVARALVAYLVKHANDGRFVQARCHVIAVSFEVGKSLVLFRIGQTPIERHQRKSAITCRHCQQHERRAVVHIACHERSAPHALQL